MAQAWDFFSSILQFLIDFFNSLISFISSIPRYTFFAYRLALSMPSLISIFLVLTVSVSVVIFIVKRI